MTSNTKPMEMQELNPESTPIRSTDEINPIRQQQEIEYLQPATSPNLPCGDLLGNRDDYNKICVPLYNASINGHWRGLHDVLGQHRDRKLLGFAITENYDTVLHIAASSKIPENKVITLILYAKIKMEEYVENLVRLMTVEQLALQNKNYNTALCLAAAAGNIQLAKIMLGKNRALLDIPGSEGMLPLQFASLHGKGDMVKYLYLSSNKMTGEFWTDQKRSWVFLRCAEADLFEVALKMVTDRQELTDNWSVLGVFARKTNAFKRKMQHPLLRIMFLILLKKTENQTYALQLLRIIWKNIVKLPKDKIDDIIRGPADVIINEGGEQKPKYSSRLLFVAAEMGNTEFVAELIQQYPDLLWKTNDNNQTLFHVAILHRQKAIYDFIYQIGSMKDMITPLQDSDGNTILHLVAMKNQHQDSSGVQHIRRQLLWFKKVEALIPPCYRETKNKVGLTPRELFKKEHKDVISANEKWMKGVTNQCLVVAALIASIGFTAAFSVPGGYNQISGIPIFLRNRSFIVFLISDAMSLTFSSVSILIFLTIFISGDAGGDFVEKLPQTLIAGIGTLFFSIIIMLIGFGVSFFILYHENLIWVPIIISIMISLPIMVYCTFDEERGETMIQYQNPRF